MSATLKTLQVLTDSKDTLQGAVAELKHTVPLFCLLFLAQNSKPVSLNFVRKELYVSWQLSAVFRAIKAQREAQR